MGVFTNNSNQTIAMERSLRMFYECCIDTISSRKGGLRFEPPVIEIFKRGACFLQGGVIRGDIDINTIACYFGLYLSV